MRQATLAKVRENYQKSMQLVVFSLTFPLSNLNSNMLSAAALAGFLFEILVDGKLLPVHTYPFSFENETFLLRIRHSACLKPIFVYRFFYLKYCKR